MMKSDKEKLDDAKRRFLQAEQEIHDIHNSIARAACPLKVDDTVTIVKNGKEYQGIVNYIGAALTSSELLTPIIGAETGWVASGRRIKKTTGELGK
ncbi:MAG TPA: hypothetical protein VG897_13130 [Terriglobales bacterium]|nr:hypothetical protein [Terriglobales bacterium]